MRRKIKTFLVKNVAFKLADLGFSKHAQENSLVYFKKTNESHDVFVILMIHYFKFTIELGWSKDHTLPWGTLPFKPPLPEKGTVRLSTLWGESDFWWDPILWWDSDEFPDHLQQSIALAIDDIIEKIATHLPKLENALTDPSK